MECTNCRYSLRDGAVFCPNCGQRTASATTGQTVAGPTGQNPWADTPFGGDTRPQGSPPQTGSSGATTGQYVPPSQGGYSPPPQSPYSVPGGDGYAGSAQPGFAGSTQPGYAPAGGGQQAYGPPPGQGYPYAPARPRAAGGFDFNTLLARLKRLARFDTSVFREAANDPAAMLPGIATAVVAILLMALGGWLWGYFKFGDVTVGGVTFNVFDRGKFFVRSVLIGTVAATAMWAAWVFIAATVLQRLFRQAADPMKLLAPMGLAAAPFAIGLLAFIDPVHRTFGIGALVAGALTMQAALQESTDAPLGQVVVANLLGFLAFALILGLLGGSERAFAPGIFLFA